MKIVASGDIALCRGVEKKILEGYGGTIASGLRDILKGADLFLANVECPLTNSKKPRWNYFPTLKASCETGVFLKDIGVDIASLANNHITDYDKRGMADTISVLEDQGIKWLGAGWSHGEAREPLIADVNGIRVGILALAQPEISAAWKGSWGAGLLEDDFAIKKMKELRSSVDIAIAYMHFGVEFFEVPTPHHVKLSRSLVDAGANLVIGHHPHVPQGFEYYKDGFIAYSLGNFIFDMPEGPHKFSRMGMLIEADFNGKTLKKIEIIPFESSRGNPVLFTGKDKEEALQYLNNISSVINDKKELIRQYYFTCRGNFNIFARALLYYGFRKMNPRRIKDIIFSQFWPQLLRMRRDLFIFLLSGTALKYEKDKETDETRKGLRPWKTICRFMRLTGTGWGKVLYEKYIDI